MSEPSRRTFLGGLAVAAVPRPVAFPALSPDARAMLDFMAEMDSLDISYLQPIIPAVNGFIDDLDRAKRAFRELDRKGYVEVVEPAPGDYGHGPVYRLTDHGRRRVHS